MPTAEAGDSGERLDESLRYLSTDVVHGTCLAGPQRN